MTGHELIRRLVLMEDLLDEEVLLEVGGDGAVHTDFLIGVHRGQPASTDTPRIVLSAEDA